MATQSHALDSAPNVHELLELLADIKHLWYEIGLALRISYAKLHGLLQENVDNIVKLSTVLQCWINENKEVTWDSIITAVRSEIVGQIQLSQEIEFYVLQGDVKQTYQIMKEQQKTKAAKYAKGGEDIESTVVGDIEMTTPPTIRSRKRSKQEEVTDDDVDEVTTPSTVTPSHKKSKQEEVVIDNIGKMTMPSTIMSQMSMKREEYTDFQVVDTTSVASSFGGSKEQKFSNDSSKKKKNNIQLILDKKPEKKHVVSLLAKNADEYRKLAIELDIDSGFVKGLSGDDNVVKLDEVIGKWMKTQSRSSPVTWRTIIEAVESDTFGNNVELANKIRNWLEKDENFSYYYED